MLYDHEDAASKINSKIEDLVRDLDHMTEVDEEYVRACTAIKELATASTMLVPPDSKRISS